MSLSGSMVLAFRVSQFSVLMVLDLCTFLSSFISMEALSGPMISRGAVVLRLQLSLLHITVREAIRNV